MGAESAARADQSACVILLLADASQKQLQYLEHPLRTCRVRTRQTASLAAHSWHAQQLVVGSQTSNQASAASNVGPGDSRKAQASVTLGHGRFLVAAERPSDSHLKPESPGPAPNTGGFVPAYITGNAFLCKLPLR